MINRRSICSYGGNKITSGLNTSLKKPNHLAKRLITSGVSTKASPNPIKDLPECIEHSSHKENTYRYINSLSISPTPKLNPKRLDFQSDFISHKKRKHPDEIIIREKKKKDLKCSKMSLELKNISDNETEFFRLYHENEIMPNDKLNSILNKVECDNDCPTDSNQITLAIKYLESQLLQAIELNKKSIN